MIENPKGESNGASHPEDRPNPPILGVTHSEDGHGGTQIPGVLSILPIRGVVVFPGTVVPLSVRRFSSRKLLEETLPQSKIIGIVTQRDENQEAPALEDLHSIGVAVNVLKMLRQADDSFMIVVQALERIRLQKVLAVQPFIRAEVEVLPPSEPAADDKQWQAAVKNLRESAVKLIELTPEVPDQARSIIVNLNSAGQLADFLAGSLNLDVAQRQDLLEELDVVKRIRAVQLRVSAQLEIAQIQ